MSRILIIAPHPDDEVLGCGGTIKKKIALGDEAYLCLITRPLTKDWSEEYIKNKDEEIARVKDFIGFKEAFFLDFPALRTDTVSQKDINDKLSDLFMKVNPDALFIPFRGDVNHDHRIVFDACIVASKPKPGWAGIKKILAYEISPTTDLGSFKAEKISDIFIPNYYEDISNFLNEKIRAMEFYKSELREFPNPRSKKGIEVLAQKRGMESGFKAAEAFILLREVNP